MIKRSGMGEPAEVQEAREEVRHNPESADAHETLGCLLAEHGQSADAMASLQQAAKLAPSVGAEKFLYMAQLHSSPQEALENARTGASIAQAEDPQGMAPSALSLLSECLLPFATAGDTNAADEAESAAAHAATLDPRNPDPCLALGQVKAARGNLDEALSHARLSAEKWSPSLAAKIGRKARVREKLHEDADGEEGKEDENDDDDENVPSFEQRFSLAKLLLDCDTSAHAAVDVLEQLYDEQRDSSDILYTLALAYHAGGRFHEARETLSKLPEDVLTDEAVDLRAAIDESERNVKASLYEGDSNNPSSLDQNGSSTRQYSSSDVENE